jgi:hypothetical protein
LAEEIRDKKEEHRKKNNLYTYKKVFTDTTTELGKQVEVGCLRELNISAGKQETSYIASKL